MCCTFHDAGGTRELSCGGDLPSSEGKYSRACAIQAGGDCTCGVSPLDEDYESPQDYQERMIEQNFYDHMKGI